MAVTSQRSRGKASSEPSSKTMSKMVSLAEAAEWASMSERTLRRRISDGSLTGYRVGPRLIRVDLAELATLLRQIPATG